MGMQERAARLERDEVLLQSLSDDSTLLSIESTGSPADFYRLTFRGQGIARLATVKGDEVEWADEHVVELRLPFLYPVMPPDIRWDTPIFHPNLSFSGFLNLDDVGLPWSEEVGLDVVCERLWDVARLAYVNLECAVNGSAKHWIEENEGNESLVFPVDPRPLRKIELPGARSNVVKYNRRSEGGTTVTVSPHAAPPESAAPPPLPHQVEDDILILNESTVAQQDPPDVNPVNSPEDDDGIFYISE